MRLRNILIVLPAIAAVFAQAPEKLSSLAQQILDAQNAVRAKVNVPPLTWSDHLAEIAQQWANHLISTGGFAHSHNPETGENLYEIEGANAAPETVINAWASEVKNYTYSTNACAGVCGHYTQLVWAATKEVGCAAAQKGRRQVWVCEYSPPGNYVGRKPY
ncbi:MAG TPA: CAP domain-containing protein [Bryobacteraceae bacterium]|nr:CAP domain-containing protein [Bryobacteraceae bacterium]